MGNSSTKESRGDAGHRGHRSGLGPGFEAGAGASHQSERPSSSRRNRVNRAELGGMLGIGSPNAAGAQPQPPYERRETRQEREARRLEKERVARIKERERSIKEEHVDGGYLVTLGTYTGTEDFNKQVVRQLQIERKVAPFWRGLNDIDPQWIEPQIIAAARGLPVPPADQTPPDELIPRPLPAGESPTSSSQNLHNLTVPLGDRTQSTASDHSASNAGSALPSPVGNHSGRTNSPFKPRGKALAAVLGATSRNSSTTEIVPREITLPNDPFVNGQPLEVALYKAPTECPICFLSYPPYLNHTRCCDQEICSECFVQIKRPEPHFPEGHNENEPNRNPEEAAGLLVSEAACCPYCTQPDFGVTYEPPPFRRGLVYALGPPGPAANTTAMSSTSSLNSGNLSPVSSPTASARRRAQSLSANAPNVTLTDRIRPEWATKLQSARAHQARRAAAATALHTAAFLMSNTEARPFRVGRFSRRNTAGSSTPPIVNPNPEVGDNGDSGAATPSQPGPDLGPRGSSGRGFLAAGPPGSRRSRMEDLEDMMFMEAIRLSLAEEEERKRKYEKQERKEAKKREKEERKAQKAASKHGGPYEAGGRSGQSSASGSTLSLPGFGRKRGNSAASNLRLEASVASAVTSSATSSPAASEPSPKDKGKAVDRSLPSTPETSETGAAEGAAERDMPNPSTLNPTTTAPRPVPSPTHHGPSHLRQMSSASSVSSSLADSQPGSYQAPPLLHDPRASGLSLGSRSAASEDGGDHDRDPSSSTEPMFNFRSLAEVVGVTLEGENAGRRLSRIEAEQKAKDSGEEHSDHDKHDDDGDSTEIERVEDVSQEERGIEQSAATLKPEALEEKREGVATSGDLSPAAAASSLTPPVLTVTPDTPAPLDEASSESKQLGYGTTGTELSHHFTQ